MDEDIPQHQNNHYQNYLSKSVSDSIFFTAPTCDEIVNTIHSLNLNKAVSHDNIPAYFLRIAAPNVTPYLQHFIEFTFVNGIFPENCTRAKIISIHKKGDKIDPNNHRPISILTCFTKILERLIYERFLAFLKKHNVIKPSTVSKNIPLPLMPFWTLFQLHMTILPKISTLA